MKNAEVNNKLKDEIREKCVKCGLDCLIAYWDYELESYIYLSDAFTCSKCEAEVELECEPA